VLERSESGRGFLQYLHEVLKRNLGCSHFFESLKSERRMGMVEEVNNSLLGQMKTRCPDVLECLDSMSDFDIYAADGHAHAASAHAG
jgi:hypothetical protein